jgi:hypothetical protein
VGKALGTRKRLPPDRLDRLAEPTLVLAALVDQAALGLRLVRLARLGQTVTTPTVLLALRVVLRVAQS